MSMRSWDSDVKVEILTPRKILFSGEAAQVILPAEDGEMSVWDFHEPCICRLKRGRVRLSGLDLGIQRGIARAGAQTLTVLVEDAGLEAS